MTSLEIKNMWLNFFINKGHYQENSFSLIPENDPTLLWVNAGITPLKKYFNGSLPVVNSRIVNIQKCLRTNDIENVGKTSTHHTFFEMLGNFSIGNYFKKEAIDFAYELLMSKQWFGFDSNKIYITYYYKDIETLNLWLKKDIHPEHLISLESNFWNIGQGPCGPCTEIFFDRGSKYHPKGKELIKKDIPNNRFVEIWNIVFSQYNFNPENKKNIYQELPSKNIDTGAGLERLACILQDVENNFETDIFFPIIQKISYLSSIKYQNQEAFKVISDHIRTLVFAIGDGVIFANDGRGYVLKKILRRAIQKGKILNFKKPFLYKLIPIVVKQNQFFYPKLKEYQSILEKIIYKEEKKFFDMLENCEEKILNLIKNNFLSGEQYFKLYDTYGIPKEIILNYCEQKGFIIDNDGFIKKLESHKNLSKLNQHFKLSIQKKNDKFLNFKDKSNFIGYNILETKTKVIKIFEEGIILEKTPFYPNMGGQINDKGFINNIPVKKIIRLHHGQLLHQVQSDLFYEDQEVIAKIDFNARKQISLHHTATHLLQDAIILILGKHIEQKGSFIGDNLLRWDFNHYEKIKPQDILKFEIQVNKWIQKKTNVIIKEILFSDAKKIPNIKYFKDKKYPEIVRIVQMDDYSITLCAGTHAKNTKDLKKIIILSCNLISSGIYRIEASVGLNAINILNQKINFYLDEKKNIIKKAQRMSISNFKLLLPENIIITESFQDILNYKLYIQNLQRNFNFFKKELLENQKKYVLSNIKKFIPSKITTKMFLKINDKMEMEVLKYLLEYLFVKFKMEILLICYLQDDKMFFLCKSATLHAGQIIKTISQIAEGFGGGNNKFAQGSTKHPNKLKSVLKYWNDNLS
ncbi:Alanyl-tRNA synthetase [Candidatus Phytoplasma mali]|uniref:Alanine--tRNA ligase n=2 Tax=Apple proliferation phytoplasma TaxID=37692 RepID=B3QZP8_PHYMT|nr:Alanyl-tRNA synthetase [Candidatus Phytoplasma mali]